MATAFSNMRTEQADSTNPVHVACQEVLENNPLKGLTDAQLNQVYDMMQYAWNRGYKQALYDEVA